MDASQSSYLWAAFHEVGVTFSTKPAVRTPGGLLTFREMFAAADRAAEAFRRAGLPEGCYVVFAAPNSLGFFSALLGLWRMSATVGLLSPMNGPSELKAIDRETDPFAYLVPTSQAESWAKTVGATIVGVEPDLVGERFCLLFPDGRSRVDTPSNAALIKFTSGSTGGTKGIALSAANILAEAAAVADTLGVTADDTIMAPIPVCHSYGFDLGGLSMLSAGATLVMPDTLSTRRVVTDLGEGRCSIFLGVPTIFRALLDVRLSAVPTLSAVRYLLSCTAPLSPELIVSFHSRFDAWVCQHYGSSEAGAVTTHIPSAVADRPESVGQAMKNVSLTIQSELGGVAASGEEGEVVVRGPAVSQRYVMGAEATRPLGNGSVRMGDLGVLDADGFLYLRGRMDQVINVGGFKVSPLEVTRVIERYPAVREAAVTGVRDGRGEEVIYAAVTLRQAATETEIIAFCRAQLAEYKVPRRIHIRPELPRGPTGKIRLRPEDADL